PGKLANVNRQKIAFASAAIGRRHVREDRRTQQNALIELWSRRQNSTGARRDTGSAQKCNSLKLLRSRSSAAFCSLHSLQHVLERAFGLRELLCIAGS